MSINETISLEKAVNDSAAALLAKQRADGHWVFNLEADATIPAEYVLYLHYLDERDPELEQRIGVYLRDIQEEHGGWPLFHRGDFNISASVKAYYALKAIGDDIDAPHMVRAREAILAHGGAATANVFTRTLLALFGQIPWKGVPIMPVEIMILPKWFPFHLDKVSYWSRTVIAPLTVLMTLRPQARNPLGIHIRELFVTPPEKVTNWYLDEVRSNWAYLFRGIDMVLQKVYRFFPKSIQKKAIDKAVAFVDERLNGLDGLGAIFPAMVNSVLMYDVLGVPKDDPRVVTAKQSIRNLIVDEGHRVWVQPCLSPIWDTALATHAILEVGGPEAEAAARKACDWMAERQITDVVGDWAAQRPGLEPGGWAFQYANPHYPDVDDTAVVMAAMDRLDPKAYEENLRKGAVWLRGMQCKDGGWGAFDAENTAHYLNHIPFADHGALLDPPTADVSARCVSVLSVMGKRHSDVTAHAGVDYLLREQEKDGSWFGRWGTNFVYGTWSSLCALNAAGLAHDHPAIRKAVKWLESKQREDGGWGEDGRSYWTDQPRGEAKESTPSQTAWAVLGLMAAGEVASPAVARGIDYLIRTRNAEGLWDEELYTAVGFPRVFYLRYHGYRQFFPVWALARYRNLTTGNAGPVMHAL
ncbi:squalene-hopene cyclase [Paramagnetospirillum marisnigri]|uniref:Squalene-hopene cyclase n=1 Tax=Paramagnetospirillum marisnigri TaxID=1285242 RepID=A0A178MT64_9PROT|nr:squalene--hopene cyclase [Paramagnetospirillum marisnigri]OAN51341.1 squalene-hopene cyclase [Paramagnetospirillum marisnigri]